MQRGPVDHTRHDCDGCGAPASGPTPPGWFTRPLDPPYYTGPRQLLFCPRCFANLPPTEQPTWCHQARLPAESWLAVAVRRLYRQGPLRRRGPIG
jgi:hypothetical protein